MKLNNSRKEKIRMPRTLPKLALILRRYRNNLRECIVFSQSAGSPLAGSAGSGGRFRVVTRQRARWGSRPGEAKHVLIKGYLKVFKKCLEHVRRWDDAVYLSATRNLFWRLTIRWFSVRYDARNSQPEAHFVRSAGFATLYSNRVTIETRATWRAQNPTPTQNAFSKILESFELSDAIKCHRQIERKGSLQLRY